MKRGSRNGRPMRTRGAILPDAEQVHALISAYSGDGTLLPRTLAEICENIRDFVVLESGDRIIGCGALGRQHAARFAAKEAGMKALGTGWHGGITWQDFEVANLPSGRPTLIFHGRAAEVAAELGVRSVALSLTHTKEQALAMVILEGKA